MRYLTPKRTGVVGHVVFVILFHYFFVGIINRLFGLTYTMYI